MLRSIGSVIAGYIVMFIGVFVSFTGAYLAMGADRAYTPGTYNASTLWLVVSAVLGLVAAVLGGLTCALIAKPRSRAPKVLAGVVLVLGVLFAIPVFLDNSPDPGPRTADVSNIEAMTKTKQPKASAAANPFIGAVGVLLGASLRRAKKPA